MGSLFSWLWIRTRGCGSERSAVNQTHTAKTSPERKLGLHVWEGVQIHTLYPLALRGRSLLVERNAEKEETQAPVGTRWRFRRTIADVKTSTVALRTQSQRRPYRSIHSRKRFGNASLPAHKVKVKSCHWVVFGSALPVVAVFPEAQKHERSLRGPEFESNQELNLAFCLCT